MANDTTTTIDLQYVLDSTANQIVSLGTQTESGVLAALAVAALPLCPGAADALVDWEGSEVARLRAFDVVHRTLLREVAAVQHQILLSLIGASSIALAA